MPNLTIRSAGVNFLVSRSRCIVRCATLVALLTPAVCCTGGAAAQDADTASTAPRSLSVSDDASTDLVSIDSRHSRGGARALVRTPVWLVELYEAWDRPEHVTPPHQILEELSRPAVLTVEILEPIPDQLVSVEIDQLVSVEIDQLPLLEELSPPAVLTVELLEPIPDQLVSVEIDQLPLEEAIRQLVGEEEETPFTIAYVSGVDVINAVLRGDSADEVKQTAAALEQRGSATETVWAVDNLLVLVADQHVPTRSAAVWALKILAPGQAVTPLIDLLDVEDPEVRKTAAADLAALGDERAAAPLARAITDPDAGVQAAAVRALIRLGGERSSGLLVGAFADVPTDLHQRVAIEMAAGDVHAKAALAQLIIEGRFAGHALSGDVLQEALRPPRER